jgi:YbbR domain-containing protein
MRNLFLKILALFAAILFWFLVVGLENTFFVLPQELEIQAFNLPENLVLKEQLGKVKVTLKSNSGASFAQLNPVDFRVYVDLKDFSAGSREVEVLVSAKNPEVIILKVEPQFVRIDLVEIKSKTVPLNFAVQGSAREGFQIKEVILDTKEVQIKGADDVLEKVAELRALVTLQGNETQNFTQKSLIKAFDSKGLEILGVNLPFNETNVAVVIEQGLSSKMLGIEPIIDGELTDFWVRSLTINPAAVQVRGNNSQLTAVSVLKTKPFDVGLLVEDEIEVDIELPEGITLAENMPTKVKIKAQLQKIDQIIEPQDNE